MGMVNGLWGATISEFGGTYLHSRGRINIKEGYNFGSTYESVDLGEYGINEFSNLGYQNERISLQLSHINVRQQRHNNLPPERLISHSSYWTTFSYKNEFENQWNIVQPSAGITHSITGASVFLSGSITAYLNAGGAAGLVAQLNEPSDIDNFHLYSRIKTSDGDNVNLNLLFNIQDIDQSNKNYYLFSIFGATATLFAYVNNGLTRLSARAMPWSIQDDMWYEWRITKYMSHISLAGSTDWINYHAILNMNDNLYYGGNVGFAATCGVSGQSLSLDLFNLEEIGTKYLSQDVLSQSIKRSGIDSVSFEYTDLINTNIYKNKTTSGSSFVQQNNEIYLINTAGGSEWSGYAVGLSGSDSTEFIPSNGSIEVDIKGISGNWAGIGQGSYSWLGNLTIPSRVLWAMKFGAGASDIYGVTNNNLGPYFVAKPDTWYRVRMNVYSTDNVIRWYVNDQLVGTKFSTGNLNSPALVGSRNGIAGSTTVFRNWRVLEFDTEIDSVELDSSTAIGEVTSRFMRNSDIMINSGDDTELFSFGASRGGIGITTEFNIENIAHNINNDQIDAVIVNNERIQTSSFSGNTRIARQVSESNIIYLTDDNLQNTLIANKATNRSLQINNSFEKVELNIAPHVTLQNGDYIHLNNNGMGIGSTYIIISNNKDYSASSGGFRQSLLLSKLVRVIS